MEAALKCSLLTLDLVIVAIDGYLFLKLCKAGLDLSQNIIQLLLILLSVFDRLMHSSDLLLESCGTGALAKSVEEAGLAALHQLLDLALLDDLVLRLRVCRLEEAKQVTLRNGAAVDVVFFAIGAAVVSTLDGDLCGVDRNLPLAVVQDHLHPIGVCGGAILPLRQRRLHGEVVEKSALLLLR